MLTACGRSFILIIVPYSRAKNVNAHIFEDALCFLKQVHALIFQHKKYFKKKTCTFIQTRNDFDNKKKEKYFNIKKSSGISYLIIKNQISTKNISNIMGYRASLIQFT